MTRNHEITNITFMTELVYKKECFEIIGCCYGAFNELGWGHREKTYQKAVEVFLDQKGFDVESQLHVPIKIAEKTIGHHFIDVLVNGKIAIELKVGDHFHKRDIDQLRSYLKSKNLLLGILVNFSSKGAVYIRVPNVSNS